MIDLKIYGIDVTKDWGWSVEYYENNTIESLIKKQLKILKELSYFDAAKHKIVEDNILEIWTSFLLEDQDNTYDRITRLGYDLSQEQLEKIYETITREELLGRIGGKHKKAILLTIDPNDQSQEAVESFLARINNLCESKFTLDDFDKYARSMVFLDADTELREKRNIEFKQLYEKEQTQECFIPKKISLGTVVKTKAILKGFLNEDAPTLITASGGTGKSALILNMVLALGAPEVGEWLGFEKGKSKYTSMIVQQEDSESTIGERIQLMCQDPKLKSGLDSLFFIGNNFKVTGKSLNDNSLTDYIEANIKSMYINGEEIPDLLVLDSLSVFAGSSENDSMSMRAVMSKLFSLCAKFGMTPIVIHHHGKDLKYRGSSAIVESVRCHYTLRSVGGEKADNILKELGISETVHLNKIERPKANDLYGDFNLVYVCDNMIFKTVGQALEAAGKTSEHKLNNRLQIIRDILEEINAVLGSEEFTKLVMNKLEVSESTAKRGMSKAIEEKYIYSNNIGKNKYYYTNEDDFEEFKETLNNGNS